MMYFIIQQNSDIFLFSGTHFASRYKNETGKPNRDITKTYLKKLSTELIAVGSSLIIGSFMN